MKDTEKAALPEAENERPRKEKAKKIALSLLTALGRLVSTVFLIIFLTGVIVGGYSILGTIFGFFDIREIFAEELAQLPGLLSCQ